MKGRVGGERVERVGVGGRKDMNAVQGDDEGGRGREEFLHIQFSQTHFCPG